MVYYAYELLPKLKYLTLTGQNEEGDLEFFGTEREWDKAEVYEFALSTN